MVGREAIEQAVRELDGLKPSSAVRHLKAISDRQSELALFVAELSDELSEEVSFMCLSTFAVIVRAFELSSSPPLKPADHRIILRALRKNDEEIAELMVAAPARTSALGSLVSPAQPGLMALVIQMLAAAEGLHDEDRGKMLLILKTVIDALHATTKPPRRTRCLTLVPSGDAASRP